MKNLVYLLIIFISLPLFAKVQLTVENDAELLFVKSGERKELKANSQIELDGSEMVWVSEVDRVPVLLFPVNDLNQSVKLNAPTTRRDGKELNSLSTDKQLSDILQQFVEIQKLIAEKNTKEALNKTYALKTKYPDVSFLYFLLASVQVANGEKQEAKRSLSRGLASHPDFEDGKVMLQKLEGRNE